MNRRFSTVRYSSAENTPLSFTAKGRMRMCPRKSTSEAFKHLNMVSLADQCSNSDQVSVPRNTDGCSSSRMNLCATFLTRSPYCSMSMSLAAQIRKVTREQAVEAAQKVTLDTIYLLMGEEDQA